VALVLTSAAATADDPKPTPLPPPELPRPIPIGPVRLGQLEEEFEAAEAARDVRKAHIKLAELNVRVAESNVARLIKLAADQVISKEEVEKGKMEVEIAKAQLEIRIAELKEGEVRVKFAKKRLEDAKRGGGLIPLLPGNPQARSPAEEKAFAELRVQLFQTEVRFGETLGEVLRLDAVVAITEADLARVREAAKLGSVRAGTLEAMEAKAKDAKELAARARKAHKEVVAALTELHTKLKALEK
jgi:hypothetical protein